MTTRFHIGAKDLRGNIAAYAKRFDLLEVRADATRPTEPVLRKWRKQVPPHFEFCVVAGPHLSALKESPELDEELATTLKTIAALQARCLLLATPVEVTPSPLSRQRMGKLLERLPRDATHVIWEPRGLWETEDAAVAAKKWDIVLAVDAARDPVPVNPVAYVRLRALGETRSFGPAALGRVVEAIGARRDAYVVLETPAALAECKRLRQLAQKSKPVEGGMGRVVRPKKNLIMKVRDDEQE
jgi:uncharacterized protein YecE (DUF72 family)